jgi:hypothetical protein
MTYQLTDLPRECLDLIWDELLSVECREAIVPDGEVRERELTWSISNKPFILGKKISRDAIDYFYERNLLVSINSDEGFARMLASVIPTLEFNMGAKMPSIAFSIDMRWRDLGEIRLISGIHLPRFVALVNSMQSPFKRDCYGELGSTLQFEWEVSFGDPLVLDFTISRGGYYARKPHIVQRLVDLMEGLRWPSSRSIMLGKYSRVYSVKLSKSFDMPIEPEDFITWGQRFKKRGDELACQSDRLPAARAQYNLAAYMIRKSAFITFPYSVISFSLLPEPSILNLSLEIWVAASKLASKLGQIKEHEYIHTEALHTAEAAYDISRRCRPKPCPELLLEVKLQFANTLQEAQRYYHRDEDFGPERFYDSCYLDNNQKHIVATYFDFAQSLLQGALDRYPENINIQRKLAACKALREPKQQRERNYQRGLRAKFRSFAQFASYSVEENRYHAMEIDDADVSSTMSQMADDDVDILSTMSHTILDLDPPFQSPTAEDTLQITVSEESLLISRCSFLII